MSAEIFNLLFESAEISKFTAQERVKYIKDMTTERDIRNQIAFARDKGREEGQADARLQIAKAMLAEGLDREKVKALTGVSEEQIKALD